MLVRLEASNDDDDDGDDDAVMDVVVGAMSGCKDREDDAAPCSGDIEKDNACGKEDNAAINIHVVTTHKVHPSWMERLYPVILTNACASVLMPLSTQVSTTSPVE